MSDETTTDLPEQDPATESPDTPASSTDEVLGDGAGDGAGDRAGDAEESEESQSGAGRRLPRVERLEQEGDIAADYLELLDIADLDGDLDMDVEGDRAMVSIVGADLNQLVGANGEVLDALQELTRLAVYRETGERSRMMLDISGHRERKRQELVALAEDKISEVRSSGESVSLTPMTSFERKVVHDAVTAAGLTSESEGAEPRRFVVILPG